jgi:T-box protein 20
MKEDTVEEEDVESSLTDHEIDVEDIDDDGPLHLTGKSGGAVHLQRHRHQGSHSTLRSFKEEDDDEEDEVLDKEEMVDEEDFDGPPVGAVKSKKKSGKKSGGKSSGSGSSGSSSSSNPQIKPKCNCEQLQLVDCHLETKELWDKFNELGTEMIITKTGRSVISWL